MRVEILSAISHISLVYLTHLLAMSHMIYENGKLVDVFDGELLILMVHR